MTTKEIDTFNKTERYIGIEIKNDAELPTVIFSNLSKAKRWADEKGTIRMLYQKSIAKPENVPLHHRSEEANCKHYMRTFLVYCGGDDRIHKECEKPHDFHRTFRYLNSCCRRVRQERSEGIVQ